MIKYLLSTTDLRYMFRKHWFYLREPCRQAPKLLQILTQLGVI